MENPEYTTAPLYYLGGMILVLGIIYLVKVLKDRINKNGKFGTKG